MLKTKYQRLNKEEKKEATLKYYQTKAGQENKLRFFRLLMLGILLIIYSFGLLIYNYMEKNNSLWDYIWCAIIFIFGLVFIIGRYKIKIKKVNDYLTKK